MIEATAITVSHGSVPVLHGVDLQVRPGEIAAIIGPNGSGKTTLLKAIAGELRHGGQVRINGSELARLGPAAVAELRAVLPQANSMLFPFTVLEVVALGLLAGGQALTSEERRSRPAQALGRVGLAGFGGRFYSDLSGGEQQRVQLARVLCQVWHPVVDGAPRYLLLDEPVSSLDIKHQLQVMDVARQFADGGGGVIAILHDLNLAAMYADTVTALSGGHLAGAGRPDEVLADAVLERVFDCPLRAGRVPDNAPFVLPQSVGGSARPLSLNQARS